MMKKWIYVVLIVFEIALGLAYGLLLKNIVSIDICLITAFTIPFVVLFASSKSRQDMVIKLSEVLLASFLLTAVAVGVFSYGNQLRGEFIGEYDVIVEYVSGRGGGYADFTTPQGKAGCVDLYEYRPVIFDDDCVDVGDTIRVREYNGLFNEHYYVFVEEIH